MDQISSNKNKARSWFFRVLKINRHHKKTKNTDEESKENDPEVVSCTRRRKSFRKSLKKMHTSVKSCMFSHKDRSSKSVQSSDGLDISTIYNKSEASAVSAPESVQQCSSIEVIPADTVDAAKSQNHRIPTDEIHSLASCYWYWGPMSTSQAEEMLRYQPDGTFLVRDSSSASYLFSISFRSVGKTMHARIEYSRGKYNLYGSFTDGYTTVTELIEDAIKISENDVYCYSKKGENDCDFPVRFTKPISRYTEVRSLKYLARFVIRQYTNINDITKLPIPRELHSYLLEASYF